MKVTQSLRDTKLYLNHVVLLLIQKALLGATPDGKVVFDGEFGIIEVKCSEEYGNVDPKDI